MLAHSPRLLLLVDFLDRIAAEEKEGILLVLQLRHSVRPYPPSESCFEFAEARHGHVRRIFNPRMPVYRTLNQGRYAPGTTGNVSSTVTTTPCIV